MLFLEYASLKAVHLNAPLVPLEGVQSLWPLWAEAALDVVVNTEIPLDQVIEIVYNLICILVQESLQLAHLLVVIEILFIFGVKFIENCMVML